jgi:hypothetical protein
VKKKNLTFGTVVRVKVKRNERHRGRDDPLIGVVYQKTLSNLPYVVTEHGVIGINRNNPRSLKLDLFDLMPNQDLPLGEQMNLFRSQILAPSYKPTNLAFKYTTKEGALMVAKVFPI